MKLTKTISAALVLGASVATASAADLPSKKGPPEMAQPAPFFFVNENSFSVSQIFRGTDPGVPLGKTSKTVINFTHFDVWSLGTNFFTIDWLKSDKKDPSAPYPFGATANQVNGATEIYGLFRSTLGLNELFKTKQFSYGPLLDVSLEIGGDANTENNFIAPAKRDIVAGLEFTFALPYKGHLNISPLYYKEWNNNGFGSLFIGRGYESFKGTWDLEINYAMDLGFLPEALPLSISGYANFHGPKGNGALYSVTGVPFNANTTVEFNSEQKLSLDVSKMIFGQARSHFFDVFVAYRYWQNKFGLDHKNAGGVCNGANRGSCTENSLRAGVEAKF